MLLNQIFLYTVNDVTLYHERLSNCLFSFGCSVEATINAESCVCIVQCIVYITYGKFCLMCCNSYVQERIAQKRHINILEYTGVVVSFLLLHYGLKWIAC